LALALRSCIDQFNQQESPFTPEVIMRVPFNDLRRLADLYADEIEANVARTIRTGWWLNGQQVGGFAGEFAQAVGVAHCIPVANGTDALEIALKALSSLDPQRTEVICAANAGGYASTACYQARLTPVYADIEPASQLISTASVIRCLSDDTLAVVATHLYGGVVDVPELKRELASAGYGHVAILEDCAQAHGALLGSQRVGSLGTISTFSYYPTKNLGAFGDAGAVCTSSADLAAIVDSLRQYGWASKYAISRAGGRNSRMDEVQAAILRTLLPRLDEHNAMRRAIVARYKAAAPAGVRFVEGGDGAVAHLAVLLSPQRDRLKAHLGERGIATDIHYPILDCDQSGWTGLPRRIDPAGLSASRQGVDMLLSLPCFIGMTGEEIDAVCDALAAFS
jgi:dTDP-4-amino-4,6-dideoxygalactose transaminase